MENKTNKLINMLSGKLRAFLETEVAVIIVTGAMGITSCIAGNKDDLIDVAIYFIILTLMAILLRAISLYQDLKRLKDDKK